VIAGEYSALRYARREFISGFTGSAGTALVMKSGQAYMWTDGRYFHQAESELSAAWQLMKSGEKGVPSLVQHLTKLPRGSTVGIDSSLHAATEVLEMKKCLENKGILMSSVKVNPIDEIWGEIQPSMPISQVRTHPPRYAGQSISEKISSIKRKLFDSELMSSTNELQNVVLVLTELDEIAWTFNIRGGDVPHNPVVYSFALISNNSVSIFIDKGKLSPETLNDLKTSDVSIYPYDDFKTNLSAIAAQNPDVKILVDKDTVNYSIYEVIPNECRINITSPIALLKACKNTSEIDGMVQCHRRDGAAVVAFLHWLSRYIVPTSTSISEVEIDDKLTQFRRDYSPDTFIGHSFDTIAGVGGNGAIIHYRYI
jgi:Xaa-Pro aminopeptidase